MRRMLAGLEVVPIKLIQLLTVASDVSISIASISPVQSSITLKVLNLLLPTRLSLIKSILQLLFKAVCCCKGCFTRTGSLRLPFRFLFSFKSL
jgi:hypothetical protein